MRMFLDPRQFEAALVANLARWRQGLPIPALAQANPQVSPFDRRLLQFEPDPDDFLFASALPWLQVLRAEHAAWPERVAIARAWQQPRQVAGRDGDVSVRQLRSELLTGRSPRALGDTGQAFVAAGQGVRARIVDALALRFERDARLAPACQMGEVAGGPQRSELAAFARRFLQRSASLGPDELHWTEMLGVAMGRGAREGWPAHLNRRWLIGIFGSSGLLHGLPLEVALPQPWGASTFGRALGNLGQAVLQASRPAALPLGMHVHPIGVRQHRWCWLFATLLLETSFARDILGLSGGRLAAHQRHVARALAASLRIDALRVLLLAALAAGREQAEDSFAELGVAVLGRGAEPALLGLLPTLGPLAAASFAGSVLGREDSETLVGQHDEDWFRNPKAAEQLRHLASQPREETNVDVATLNARSERLVSWLEGFV